MNFKISFFILVILFTSNSMACKTSNDATIFIDNYTGRDILIKVDGEKWLQIKDKSSTKKTMSSDQYEISLFDLNDNRQLDKFSIKVESPKKYVLNLLGGSTYLSDASIKIPQGLSFDADKILGSGESINEQFFIADQDFVLEEMPKNFTGIDKNNSKNKTYLYRIPKDNKVPPVVGGDRFWDRDVNGKKLEALSPQNRDVIYDIIRNDQLCESIDKITPLLENDFNQLKEKCAITIQPKDYKKLEKWLVAKNQISQLILGTIPSGKLTVKEKNLLKEFVKNNDFDGYFTALDSIDPQVNMIVNFQSRYIRLKRLNANKEFEKDKLQVYENRLRHAIGFKPIPLNH